MSGSVSRREFLGLVMGALAAAGCSRGEGVPAADAPKIGIALWYTADERGTRAVDACAKAAEALGCAYQVFEHHYDPERMAEAARVFANDGCRAMICCCSTHADLGPVIDVCNERGLHLVQFMGSVLPETSPEVHQKAVDSAWFAGAVLEDEARNGRTLTDALLEAGSRRVGLVGEIEGDLAFQGRWQGAKDAIGAWNEGHPQDAATLLDPVFAPPAVAEGGSQGVDDPATKDADETGVQPETDRERAERFARAVSVSVGDDTSMDGLLLAADGAEATVGAMGALANLGRTGSVRLVSTGFIDDLREQLEVGALLAQAGGAWLDPLFAFLLAYQACTGVLEPSAGAFGATLSFPYLYVRSVEDFDAYVARYVDSFPYGPDELRALAEGGPQALQSACESLSV